MTDSKPPLDHSALCLSKRVDLRPSTPGDEVFVNALTRETMRPYVESTWQSDTEREHYYQLNAFKQEHTRIIQLDGIDIGRLSVIRQPDKMVLDEVHIRPQNQGLGIGSFIVTTVVETAMARRIPLYLQVLKANPARNLYQRKGFVSYSEDEQRCYMVHVSDG